MPQMFKINPRSNLSKTVGYEVLCPLPPQKHWWNNIWAKILCENSRIQLRICSILEEHKTEKKCFEMGKRSSLTLSVTASPPNFHGSALRSTQPPISPSWEGVREASTWHPSLLGCCPKTYFHLASLRALRQLAQLECWGVREGVNDQESRWELSTASSAARLGGGVQSWDSSFRRGGGEGRREGEKSSLPPAPSIPVYASRGGDGFTALSCITHLASTGKIRANEARLMSSTSYSEVSSLSIVPNITFYKNS